MYRQTIGSNEKSVEKLFLNKINLEKYQIKISKTDKSKNTSVAV